MPRKVYSLNLVRFRRNGQDYICQALVVGRARSWRMDVWAAAFDPYGGGELPWLGFIEPGDQNNEIEVKALVADLCARKYDVNPD